MNTKLFACLIMAATLALPLTMSAQRRSSRSTDVSGPVTSCGDIRTTFDRRPAITEETEMTLTPAQVQTLRIQAANDGIYVRGWDRNEYSIKTCKAVPDDDPNASSTLRQISTTNANGRITINGPAGVDWAANLIVMVPRLSTLDLETRNGPLSLRDLAGNIQVNASNGPIHLENVGGSVQATTNNGPISVKGGSGDQRLTASNGPIHVALSGSRWDGPGLEVSTRNGPLTISIPDGYGSGVQAQASGRAPINCTSPACAGATRSLSSPVVIRLGSGEPVVRVSTSNGPLSIQP